MWGLLGSILIGILAGFIAGKSMKGGGFGCLWNLILGVVGGFVGGFILDIFDIVPPEHWWVELLTAVGGAVLVLWVASKIKG